MSDQTGGADGLFGPDALEHRVGAEAAGPAVSSLTRSIAASPR